MKNILFGGICSAVVIIGVTVVGTIYGASKDAIWTTAMICSIVYYLEATRE